MFGIFHISTVLAGTLLAVFFANRAAKLPKDRIIRLFGILIIIHEQCDGSFSRVLCRIIQKDLKHTVQLIEISDHDIRDIVPQIYQKPHGFLIQRLDHLIGNVTDKGCH